MKVEYGLSYGGQIFENAKLAKFSIFDETFNFLTGIWPCPSNYLFLINIKSWLPLKPVFKPLITTILCLSRKQKEGSLDKRSAEPWITFLELVRLKLNSEKKIPFLVIFSKKNHLNSFGKAQIFRIRMKIFRIFLFENDILLKIFSKKWFWELSLRWANKGISGWTFICHVNIFPENSSRTPYLLPGKYLCTMNISFQVGSLGSLPSQNRKIGIYPGISGQFMSNYRY